MKIFGKQTLMAITLGLVLLLSAATYVVAEQPWSNTNKPNYDSEVHEQLQSAMDNGDYAEWRRIREENDLPMHGRMMAELNEQNFGEFVRMRAAYHSGDSELAEQIRSELRPREGYGSQGMGMHHGRNQGHQRYRQIVATSSE